jgi:SNW domain-containing protein 1
MAKVTGGEAMYDQRLFNQDTGMDTGLATDDAYNLYDKPLFADRSEVFKGRGNREEGVGGGADVDTTRFKPDKGFSGVDYSKGADGGGDVPQFERDAAEADPFGLDAFLSDVHQGRRPLDKIGKGGGMAAAGGGGGGYDDYASGKGGRRVEFASSGGDKGRR